MSTQVESTSIVSRSFPRPRLRVGIFYGTVLPLLAISVLAGIAIGSTPIGWRTILHVLALKLLPSGWTDASGLNQADIVIVWLIRVPRVVVAACVGAALSAAGVIMQALLRNPLAEPGLVGAGSGAVLGAVIAFVAGWSGHSVVLLPIAAIVGALCWLSSWCMAWPPAAESPRSQPSCWPGSPWARC